MDDHPDMRDLIAEVLERDGWSVRACESAEEALNAVADRSPDILLTDIHMRGLGGAELADRLRSRTATCGLPLVAITGKVAPTSMVLKFFDAFLFKPIDLATLAPMLRALIEKHHAED